MRGCTPVAEYAYDEGGGEQRPMYLEHELREAQELNRELMQQLEQLQAELDSGQGGAGSAGEGKGESEGERKGESEGESKGESEGKSDDDYREQIQQLQKKLEQSNEQLRDAEFKMSQQQGKYENSQR